MCDGSCSTPGDLIAWTNALHGGGILGASAYRQMITADTLGDGIRLRYAKGPAVDSILGHRAIHHGGDITGFTVDASGAARTARIGDGPVRKLTYLGGETFARGDTRYTFGRDQHRVATLHFDNVYDLTATVHMPARPELHR